MREALIGGAVLVAITWVSLWLRSRARCPHCRAWIAPDASVCRHCGRSVTTEV